MTETANDVITVNTDDDDMEYEEYVELVDTSEDEIIAYIYRNPDDVKFTVYGADGTLTENIPYEAAMFMLFGISMDEELSKFSINKKY